MMNQSSYILLIEDSPSQALQFQLLIKRYTGHEVRVVSDGAEGWNVACSSQPLLIMLDINLPTLDGFQVLNRLKRGRLTSHIPVIMLTTSDRISDVERALSLGASDYLFKDDCFFKSKESSDQLREALEQAISAASATSATIESPDAES
jgi:twitching motility two-component system response regulator PilH